MDEQDISGKQIRPDGTEEYWWQGDNYKNVIPEELFDAVLASEKQKRRFGGKNNESKRLSVRNIFESGSGIDTNRYITAHYK